MEKGIYLVLGGTRSGKSIFAEKLVKKFSLPVIYLATAVVTDEEMKNRVKIHKARRDVTWTTYEEPYNIPVLLNSLQGKDSVLLLDCLSVYISNLLWKVNEEYTLENYKYILSEIEKLIACLVNFRMNAVIVSSETGLGIIPSSKSGRFYRDLLGEANQMVAKAAQEVYLVVSGVPIGLKSLSNLTTSNLK
ncbi:MAG: bifunctional adenosylcobinamide kinase/adenosylcobinamide-phosphate guanylyltransferase [Zhaonellaceae bacterium]|jgi:adenosylcobinamide kinase/adenosylcobinamide-phosphate guanylyltransferase